MDNNQPPVITSNALADLGTVSEGFTITYQVSDPDGDAITVTEKLDNSTLRSFAATAGANNVLNLTGLAWMRVLNGTHTLTIIATDTGGKSTTRAVMFSKAVYACRITLEEPMEADADITKMVMNIVRGIPADAEFKVLATNNALDENPVWEDITSNVMTGINHVFDNTGVETTPAFNFIITASRGPGGSGGHIGTIGGAFE